MWKDEFVCVATLKGIRKMTVLLTLLRKPNANPLLVIPREFLDWAKDDLRTNDKRSIGNGLGNIKKAIHCRIDELIDSTHIKYCKNWNKRADTDTKLEALKLLNIKYTSVVSLLTDIRNKYEHFYKLPEYKQALAYLDTAEMWIDFSYNKCSFNKIGVVKLETKGFGVQSGANGMKLTDCTIDSNSDLDYLWESKKEVHEIKNGNLTIKPMDTCDWKSMAKYEAKHLIFEGTPNKTEFNLPSRLLTTVYKKALKQLIK